MNKKEKLENYYNKSKIKYKKYKKLIIGLFCIFKENSEKIIEIFKNEIEFRSTSEKEIRNLINNTFSYVCELKYNIQENENK